MSNADVGGKIFEVATTEYFVRGRGYIKRSADIENIVLKVENGTPVYMKNVGTVHLGPDIRRGVAELDGKGEVVGGIVVMRYGENALTRHRRHQKETRGDQAFAARRGEGRADLRPQRTDQSRHRHAARKAHRGKHRGRAGLHRVPLARALGAGGDHHAADCDHSFVPPDVPARTDLEHHVARRHRHRHRRDGRCGHHHGRERAQVLEHFREEHGREPDQPRARRERYHQLRRKSVGRPLFFSLLVITVSFIPVFSLEAQEGRLFKPLAFTKTFSMFFAALLGVTLVPVLMVLFIRGKITPEIKNPVNRFLIWAYQPFVHFVLRFRWLTLGRGAASLLGVTIFPFSKLGNEFMPPLNEGVILYMPTAVPGMSITEATKILQIQDRMLRKFPEVETVFGKAGQPKRRPIPRRFRCSKPS